jgi:hypothetical protein
VNNEEMNQALAELIDHENSNTLLPQKHSHRSESTEQSLPTPQHDADQLATELKDTRLNDGSDLDVERKPEEPDQYSIKTEFNWTNSPSIFEIDDQRISLSINHSGPDTALSPNVIDELIEHSTGSPRSSDVKVDDVDSENHRPGRIGNIPSESCFVGHVDHLFDRATTGRWCA